MHFDFPLIESILFITFQCISFAIAMRILEDVKYDKRDLYNLVFLFILPSVALFFIFKFFAIIYFLFYFVYLFRYRNFIHSLINACLCIVIGILSDHITSLILMAIFHRSVFHTPYFFLYFIIFLTFMIALSFLFRLGIQRLKRINLLYDKVFISILLVFLACTVIAFYTLIFNDQLTQLVQYKKFVMFFVLYALFSVMMITILSRYLRNAYALKQKAQENEHYFNYTQTLEQVNQEMRKFKHDYINILSTLSSYISNKDIEGLEKYFSEQIVPLKASLDHQLLQLNGLEKCHIIPLKGLVTSKIIDTQNAGIPLSIEVSDDIYDEDVNMDIIKLSRAVGIIWDNAIEASKEIDNPKINAGIIKHDKSILFIVANKCRDDIPSIHELYQPGFSTKGDNRGIGLLNLKEISSMFPNMFLDTSIQNGLFIQKIEIVTSH
ncbi:sensor histidine kinase [Macrococcoides canis]|uniref:sensor histidine kinase n=1 Tax=Macrococcoides canis TaxID=1855823 RepID=UPI001B8C4799|nr:GHKL domain-containing protein [Macrococcus canis]QUR94993.1 GHKL domain-containing protein [Macrococcus canis]